MSIRTERVAKLIQREIAKLLSTDFAEQVKPLVTVTDARITKDLSIADVYISVMGDSSEQRQSSFRRLEALAPEIRSELASRVRHQLRVVPELRLHLDESAQRAERMENLFDRIRAERERRDTPPDEA